MPVTIDANNEPRPICPNCKQRVLAINYKRKGKTYYRKTCDYCRKANKPRIHKPRWKEAGYHKKDKCDKCGFRSTYSDQIVVYYIDGNLNNNCFTNLRTICLNCAVVINKQDNTWAQSDLIPDF